MTEVSRRSRWGRTLGAIVGMIGALVGVQSAFPLRQAAPTAKLTLPSASLGTSLLRQVQSCAQKQLLSQPRDLVQDFWLTTQRASLTCFMEQVVLDGTGVVRGDAEMRMQAVIAASGVQVPLPEATGVGRVPLTLVPENKLLTVPVQVENRRLPFLLDTGASSTILTLETARSLKVAGTPFPNELLRYFVVGQECDRVVAELVPLPPLAVGRSQVSGLNGMALSRVGLPGSGVLGMDFLSSYDLLLNPKTRELLLMARSPFPPTGTVLVGKLGVMTAMVSLNGRPPKSFLLDTGASVMVISRRYAQEIGLSLKGAETVEVRGFCGSEKALRTRLQTVELGGWVRQNLEVVVLEGSVLEVLGVDGIVGQNYLNQFVQHWRFSDRNSLGFPSLGHLVLVPVD
ncbi:MAG: clan AA aspartic protease [Oscillatoriales cyanobacterium SM2_2_1]|nr:clan AA aspartic protease [Oscillatoriales cyanobacterium SM2_2_1]